MFIKVEQTPFSQCYAQSLFTLQAKLMQKKFKTRNRKEECGLSLSDVR